MYCGLIRRFILWPLPYVPPQTSPTTGTSRRSRLPRWTTYPSHILVLPFYGTLFFAATISHISWRHYQWGDRPQVFCGCALLARLCILFVAPTSQFNTTLYLWDVLSPRPGAHGHIAGIFSEIATVSVVIVELLSLRRLSPRTPPSAPPTMVSLTPLATS